MRHRTYSRQQRAFGGTAWTDPIPTKPRIHGSFRHFQAGVWTLCDIFTGSRGTVQLLSIRPDWTGEWAEADRYFGFDPAG